MNSNDMRLIKTFILSEYPKYYKKTRKVKLDMIRDFVKECDVKKIYRYLEW